MTHVPGRVALVLMAVGVTGCVFLLPPLLRPGSAASALGAFFLLCGLPGLLATILALCLRPRWEAWWAGTLCVVYIALFAYIAEYAKAC
jgi:hypothetical protein